VAPRARKLAEQLGIDLAGIVGSGPDGSITGDDIERAAAARTKAPAQGMRQAIAAAMSRSKHEIPHYYLLHTIDLEPALIWLEARNRERPIKARLLPVALLVRAVALALVDHRELCGHVRDGVFVPGTGIHVGLAVSLRDGGLVNTALHDADRDTLDELMIRIAEVSQRARNGGLRASELSEATITVTSLGERGVDAVLPIIHPPQVAIVGFGSIRVRPWVDDDRVAPRRLIEASLAADHRVSDGHAGARFLAQIDRLLHTPEAL
jgi:pyruvate dehydrogenase E2 component (dihydrolipoamide acetyltransferase)